MSDKRACWVILRLGPFVSEEIGIKVGKDIAASLSDLGQVIKVDVIDADPVDGGNGSRSKGALGDEPRVPL